LRLRDRIDPRARAGMLIITFVYVTGWVLGRAQGKLEATDRLLERLDGSRSRSRRS
jgi:hypothetical protein